MGENDFTGPTESGLSLVEMNLWQPQLLPS
jgi:hypothetical protein